MRSRQLYLSRAIRAADWFVNHITRQAPPVSDANRGRVCVGPGGINSCEPTAPVENATWGAIKSQYPN